MQTSKPSILVVDDTPANLTLMTGLLQDLYQVRAATSGDKALKIANADSPPDLILLDISMPDIDGMSVARQIARNWSTDKGPPPAIIFVTAFDQNLKFY